MHELTVSKTIDAPKTQVWDIIKDFGSIYKIHPLIESSPITNGTPYGDGAERTCVMYNGGEIRERVFDYIEGEKYTVEVYDPGPFPIEKSLVTISVSEAKDQKSTLIFDMKFKPKFGVVGKVMASVVMKKQFENILTQVADGLNTHLKTGKLIGKKGVLVAA
ncbi:MAG: SRPBCC family protein [Balneola sp.]|nr:MAG: SRPBCC family protein [Balneola sp.]